MRVNYREEYAVKFVQNEKYPTKNNDYLRFNAYFCHVIDKSP